jgi:ABC-type transport system involved in multi-copper enzyme maturation permease subunit
VAVVSATSVAQEKESDTWTLLLTTPVTGRTIVFGKAAGLLRRLMWPYALAAGHLLLFTVFGVIRPEAFFLAMWVMLTFNAVWLATGIYLSLRLRTVTFAVILNLLLAVVVYPGVALSLLVAGELLSSSSNSMGRNAGGAWAQQVIWYLPYSYIGVGMHGIDQTWGTRGGIVTWYTDLRFSLPCDPFAPAPAPGTSAVGNYYERRVNFPQYAAVVLTVGGLYVMAAFALLLWTARRFDRIVARASQVEKVANPAASALARGAT